MLAVFFVQNLWPLSMIADEIPEEEEEEDENDPSQDDTLKRVTCDKETNTDAAYNASPRRRPKTGDVPVATAVRRSKTFSPARGTASDYICKVIFTYLYL